MYLTGSPFNRLLTQTTVGNKLKNHIGLIGFNVSSFFTCCSAAIQITFIAIFATEDVQLQQVATRVKDERQSSQFVFVLDPPTHQATNQATNGQSVFCIGLDVQHWLCQSLCHLCPTSRAFVRRWAASHQRNTWKTVGETKHSAALFFFVPFWHSGDDARLAGQRVSDGVYLQVGATPTTSLPTCQLFSSQSGRGSRNTPTGQWSLLWPSADLM